MPKITSFLNSYCLFLIFMGNTAVLGAQVKLGDSLVGVGDYSNAIDAYKNVEQSAGLWYKIAGAHVSSGNFDQAIESYKNGMAMDNGAVQPKFELGKIYLAQNDPVSSLELFTELSNQSPNNATFLYYKARAVEDIGSDDAAVTTYKKVLELDNNYRRARLKLVPLLIKKNRTKEAILYCQQILGTNPNDIKFNSLIAQAYYNSKNYQESIKHLERLFSLGNDTDYNRKVLSLSYYLNDEWKKSIEGLEIYFEQYEDKDAQLHLIKSKAHLRLDQYDKAMDAIEYSILYKRPSIEEQYLQMASIFASREDYRGTFETMLLAQKEAPQNEDVAFQLTLAADRYFKDKSAILKYYERFNDKYGDNGTYSEYVNTKISNLKKQIFMNVDQN